MSMHNRPQGTWWLVWCPERGQCKDDGRRVVATYPEAAAVKWAERDDADSSDYSILRGNDADVLVAEDRDGAPEHRFTVSGERCPVYRARQAA